MILGRLSRVILTVLCLWMSLAAASPVASRDTSDVRVVSDNAPLPAPYEDAVDVLDTTLTERDTDMAKRANPSGHISIPNRRTPLFNSVVVGAIKVITYYTVQGAIEIYVQNLATHAASYSIRHAPGGIIDGVVPGGIGRQDVYTNPGNFAPGDVLEVSAVPK
ncbi:hypothetical protein KVT40_002447 [Elsinoe batatas]|uniref:Uncharacterized protein n=1 Tax=Elsinoe batatas TaxID=2601811 RepID=A0A8K0LA00_9PEZI|nr:hypothetical protein KVT40_002447 [Elsinoe batatas]